MSKYFIIFIKGIIGSIWLVATIVTTILIFPFVLASWISSLLKKTQNDTHDNASSEDSDS